MKKKHLNRQKVYTILIIVCLAVFLFSAYKLCSALLKYKQAKDIYDGATKQYTSTQQIESDKNERPFEVDFDDLCRENSDVKGWIYIEDTEINYPVLQGQSNQYYLDRTYNKKYLPAGSIFLDFRSNPEFTDNHTIIYGHNMKNGSMFGYLDKYENQDYAMSHQDIYIVSSDSVYYKYRVYSVYKAHVEGETFQVPMNSDDEYKGFIDFTLKESIYESDIVPTTEDKIITLSTCTDAREASYRFVVNAVLIDVEQ